MTAQVQQHAQRTERHARQPTQQAINTVNHVKSVDGCPNGKQRNQVAKRPQQHFPIAQHMTQTAQVKPSENHHRDADQCLNQRTNFHADIETIVKSTNEH
ncbi:hypothetical protein D3C78_1481350 [compost metagenome]